MTERRICGARTTASEDGHPCMMPPIKGRDRCRLHGGATPRGAVSRNFKGSLRRTDRLSMSLPARLADKFMAARQDQRLLELRDDVALVDTRIEELASQLDTGEAGAIWGRVQRAFTAFCIHRGTEKEPLAFGDLEDAIEAGSSEHERWSELLALTDQRRKLVESERKRLVEMQQMMTAEQAMTLFSTITELIRANVRDPDVLRQIDDGLNKLAALPERTNGEP